ncbi:DUF4249 domain-containing protein [Hymenobacter taeanensis]|uniref:DUF4249 domain-containing protein n=1 Tax=Hymenobacter taeanensis TaxID=2735321 RepID=A0A6M6BGV9_9BACT|nr:DUF4249 domain-containing protein [Hymenobacter taeanensis]QJX47761.1 DUF4249 domain-containing protein [Hymenobacter taeanensis]
MMMLFNPITGCLTPRARSLATGLGTGGILLLSACGLQKDIDVELPAYPAQLVVESYLENNRFPRVSVTESVPYLSAPDAGLPQGVKVVLTLPSGRRDTLLYAPAINPNTNKGYTHTGRTRISARPGDTFKLEVYDTQGRRVTGSATMPATVPLDSVEYKYNDLTGSQRMAYVLASFRDPAATVDFYRFQVHKRSVSTDPEVEYTVEDRLSNGQPLSLGTSYQFSPKDTVFVTLYHLDRPYFQFLQSVQDARNSNGNPFAQPSAIKSTVEGGIGIFTILSYQRQRLILK